MGLYYTLRSERCGKSSFAALMGITANNQPGAGRTFAGGLRVKLLFPSWKRILADISGYTAAALVLLSTSSRGIIAILSRTSISGRIVCPKALSQKCLRNSLESCKWRMPVSSCLLLLSFSYSVLAVFSAQLTLCPGSVGLADSQGVAGVLGIVLRNLRRNRKLY